MPIQFVTGDFKGIVTTRQADVYRLLHIAFDHGYIFEAGEMEQAWGKINNGWVPLPETDHEVWLKLKYAVPLELRGQQS